MPPKTNKKLHIQVYNLYGLWFTLHTHTYSYSSYMACTCMATTYERARQNQNKNDQNVYNTFDYYHHLGFCLFFTTTVLLLCLEDEVCPGEPFAPSDSLLVGAGISEGIILLTSSSTYQQKHSKIQL